MESEFLKSLVIIFGVSALVVFLLHRLKIPSIVGFLVAGAIIGPHGIGIVKDTHSVELLAEIGVILLLFIIGIEFSMAKLLRMRKTVIGGGGIQVLFTISLSAIAFYFVTGNINRSVFFGFLVALSSTAIVFKLLAEKGETDSPHGRIMVGIIIFQDLCVVPLMLLTPALSGEGIDIMEVAIKMGKAALIIAVVLLSARWLVPRLLHQVVHTKSRELFITTIILLCLGIALLTSRFGLSLALGAFLAGLIVSESEYAHQATADIMPFKDSFIGLFFVSVGMLMDIGYVSDNLFKIGLAVVLIFGLKVITGMFSALMIGSPLRTSIHTGLGLAQIGEFSFVLAIAGKALSIITEEFYQIFLSSSVLTMMITPFVLNVAPSISGWITSRHLLKRVSRLKMISEREGFPRKRQDHVIIIGFGLNGRNLARVLKEADVHYVVLEMNSDTVKEMRKKGEPIYYGDGTSKEILHKLGIEKARLLVIAISDPASARRIVAIARHENPDIYIIVRTRYLVEVDDLRELGADEVIPEEFETSVEIFSRVLHKYNFPNNIILDMVDKVRSDSYTMLRKVELPRRHVFEKYEWLPEIKVDGYKVSEDSHLVRRSIAELQVRKITGVTIIAVRRGTNVFTNPEPDFRFKEGDIIIFTGEKKNMDVAMKYFRDEV
ncbi:MAG: monovalent cation:proton antiporter-2 (CPA2) family protein [Nitrospirota bacterium]